MGNCAKRDPWPVSSLLSLSLSLSLVFLCRRYENTRHVTPTQHFQLSTEIASPALVLRMRMTLEAFSSTIGFSSNSILSCYFSS